MHVFVATSRTQGTQPDDHYCCLDGELVLWDTPGDAQHEPGDNCECLTGFFGAYSGGRSTTALVRDYPTITVRDLLEIVSDALILTTGSARDAWAITRDIASYASCFDPGDIVDRDRTKLVRRSSANEATFPLVPFGFEAGGAR
jgi:hypothetical protein